MKPKEKKKTAEQLVQFIRKVNGSTTPPGTWERVEEIRNKILTDTDNYPWRAACEELWSAVSHAQNDEYLELKRDEKPADDPMVSLLHWLEIPMYPPIEVLCAIAEGFRIYFAGQGTLTLEEAFFGPPKKGVGNHAARISKSFSYRSFERYLNREAMKAKKNGEKMPSLESIATKYLAYYKSPVAEEAPGWEPDYENCEDPESFLRSYRRWKEKGKPNS